MDEMKLVETSIARAELECMAKATFTTMIKGVVDIERGVLMMGGSLHADAEAKLLESGSLQKNIWGFNLKFDAVSLAEALEYTSMINIRPHEGNMSMDIKIPQVRQKVFDLVCQRVVW